MFLRDFGEELGIRLERCRIFAVDREVHQRGLGPRLVLAPEFLERLVHTPQWDFLAENVGVECRAHGCSRSESAPDAPIRLKQLVCFAWTPRTGWIFAHRRRGGGLVPGMLEFVDECPCMLHFVTACEERGVARHG